MDRYSLLVVRCSLATLFIALVSTLFFDSCKKDKGALDLTSSGYPENIANILITKCATPGCHTKKSKDASAGISLETWDDMFAGGSAGACCIPYSHQYSTIFLFTNTDSSIGPVNQPTMPYNQPALSAAEQKTLLQWIDAGAPSAAGKIMWSDNPNRKKFYVTNQGCDVVTVFDAATLLQMRYINVGSATDISPHMIKISPDGNNWYVNFYGGKVYQKFRTSDDSYVAQASIPSGIWNTSTISQDSKKAFVVDWEASGMVAYVDLPSMTTKQVYQGSGLFTYPHGSALSSDGNTLYLTANWGNSLYKCDVSDPINPNIPSGPNISLDGNPPTDNLGISNGEHPHDLAFTPDSMYYFVTCEVSNEVRALKTSNDSVVAVIPVGDQPVELSFSKTTSHLFVTCMSDSSTTQFPYRGSVAIIDYTNFSLIKNLKGINIAEPHGIGVDDARGLVYIANRNLDGPLPHHSTSCGGRIGFISFIDLNTLQLLSKKVEVAKDPYSIAVRH